MNAKKELTRRDVTGWASYSCRRDNPDSNKKMWDKFSQCFAVGVNKGTMGMPVGLFSIGLTSFFGNSCKFEIISSGH